MTAAFETVIGLEVHVQLATQSKLFCGCATTFGAPANVHVCPVCLGLPGALPVTNRGAVVLAVRTALALNCRVNARSAFDRKSYFYPDLPKGYQITQYSEPLANGGRFVFDSRSGDEGTVRIKRVQLEEDAGKSLHGRLPGMTGVDLNRAGIPLVEIVTEPDLRSPADAHRCLEALKSTLRYLAVSECNMEEGGLRVDANLSVRARGRDPLGTRQELKNLNSFAAVERALAELGRAQWETVSRGRRVEQMTFAESGGSLTPMRAKEDEHDYRYFPDPDLLPLMVPEAMIEGERDGLPELPGARLDRFEIDYELVREHAEVLVRSRAVADYFECAAAVPGAVPREIASWTINEVQAAWNDGPPLPPEELAALAGMVSKGELSRSAARQVFRAAVDSGCPEGVARLAARLRLMLETDTDRHRTWVEEVLAAHPEELGRLRAGDARVLDYLVGRVMVTSAGRADPRLVKGLLSDYERPPERGR